MKSIRTTLQVRGIAASLRANGKKKNSVFCKITLLKKIIDLSPVRPEGNEPKANELEGSVQIRKIIFSLCLFFSCSTHSFFPFFSSKPSQNYVQAPIAPEQKKILIMLDPAGDSANTGRKIDDSFERSITLFFAEKLKIIIEEQYTNAKVLLTRSSGQTLQPLQNANFANRLNVDLYVSINFYQESETKPRIYLYNFSYNDDFVTKPAELSFCPYEKAHLFHMQETREYSSIFKQVLDQAEYNNLFECAHMTKLPFKPLIGIKSPAVAIEAGLIKKEDWNAYVEPVIIGIKTIIEKLQ